MQPRALCLTIFLSAGLILLGAPVTGQAADAPQPGADDVKPRGFSLPNITPPPPPPPPPPSMQLPSTVPVVDSLRVVSRPRCDTRQLQPHQIAKPCSRVTSTSSTLEANMQHKLQFMGKNLLGATVSIVSGPNDVRLAVPGALGDPVGCPPGTCFDIYTITHQGTQRGSRTLQVKNPQGQTTTVQIEVVDGLVINVPPPQPGTAAKPTQLPPCPSSSNSGVNSMGRMNPPCQPTGPPGARQTGPR